MIDGKVMGAVGALLGVIAAGAILSFSTVGGRESASAVSTRQRSGAGEKVPSAGVLDRDRVCFVNNRYMGKPQIPVIVDGKTYYGCCEGCAKTLNSDRSSRFAQDPLTGKEVDKATATIAEDSSGSGSVLYFESEDTYERYRASSR